MVGGQSFFEVPKIETFANKSMERIIPLWGYALPTHSHFGTIGRLEILQTLPGLGASQNFASVGPGTTLAAFAWHFAPSVVPKSVEIEYGGIGVSVQAWACWG